MPSEKILIIDDSPIDARFASKILSQAGYTATIIHDSLEALNVARQLAPDLILLDVTMPKLDGYQVCQQLKGDPETREISTVLYTIRDQFIDCLRGIEAGADDFIVKTLSTEDFLNSVRKILGERRVGITSPMDALDMGLIQTLARQQSTQELFTVLFGSFNRHVRDTMSVFMGAHVTSVLIDRAIEKSAGRFPFYRHLDQNHLINVVLDAETLQEVPALEFLDGFRTFNNELYQLVTKLTRTRLNGAKESRAIATAFQDMVAELNNEYQELQEQGVDVVSTPEAEEVDEVSLQVPTAKEVTLSPDCTFDTNGNLIYCNDDMAKLLNYNKTELMGRPFASFLIPESRQILNRAFDRLIEKGVTQVKLQFRVKDGNQAHADAMLTALYDSQGRFAMTRCSLQIVPASMLVQEHEEEIDRLKRTLREINEEFGTLASTISHDLRQPLHAILVLCQFLKEEATGRLDEQAQGYLRSIEQAGTKMKEMIEDLVHYARINSQSNVYEEVNMGQLMTLIEDNLSATLTESGAALQVVGELPTITADRERMMELLTELIINAVKFSNNEHPQVEVGVVKEDDDGITFYVKDNGMGIEEPYHESVFRLFHKLSKPEEESGTGAGLAVCRRIVESHGGRIWVRSQLGAGTTVFFSIPHDIPAV